MKLLAVLLAAALLVWELWEERKNRYAEVARRQDRPRMYGITEIDGGRRASADDTVAPPPVALPAPLDEWLS